MTVAINKFQKCQPFLKWVGGKRALLPEIIKRLPLSFNNYYEPFVGGGALFFELKRLGLLDEKKVVLFDKNKELVNAYNVVKNNPIELIKILKEYEEFHSEEFYYQIREKDRLREFENADSILRAGRFIYLNKTCFNGLFRVNSKGFFNVPIGRYKNPSICNEEIIYSASCALNNIDVVVSDFEEVLNLASKNDFVYFDPPYYPLNLTSNFTSYHEDAFLDNEQRRLFEVFKELGNRDVFVMHSNSDTEFIKELYKDYQIDFVECPRFINSKSSGRGKIKEILVTGKRL